MDDGKDGHFDGEEEGGDADFDVGVGDLGGRFDEGAAWAARGGEEGDEDLFCVSSSPQQCPTM